MAGSPFFLIADIDYEGSVGRRSLVRQGERRDPVDSPNQFRPVLKRVHPVLQIACDIVEADPAQTHDRFLLASRIRDEDDRFVMIEQGAAPGGVLPIDADV